MEQGINLENGMPNEQSKKKCKKLSLLPAEYVNIKQLFSLSGNSEKRPWTHTSLIILNKNYTFLFFMLHLMKNRLGYAMVNNNFLLMLKILSVLTGQGMTQISIVHTNNLWESTIFFCWYQKRWICYKRKNIVRHLT